MTPEQDKLVEARVKAALYGVIVEGGSAPFGPHVNAPGQVGFGLGTAPADAVRRKRGGKSLRPNTWKFDAQQSVKPPGQ